MVRENITLIPADERYWVSYIDALHDGCSIVVKPTEKIKRMIKEGFKAFIYKYNDLTRYIPLPDGSKIHPVPADILWLMKNDRVVGEFHVRHFLIPSLEKYGGHINYAVRTTERKKGYGFLGLRLALSHAKNLELKKVLVTCSEDNIGAQKTTEKAGGVFQDVINVEGKDKLIRRYWIKL